MMRASDLIGTMVVTEAGWPIGHVVDLRAEDRDDAVEVTELLIGRGAFFHRVMGGRDRDPGGRTGPHAGVPWEAVVDVEPGQRVVVREGTEPSEQEKEEEA